MTVADNNSEYDPTSSVVVVVFSGDLKEWGIEWDSDQPFPLGGAR